MGPSPGPVLTWLFMIEFGPLNPKGSWGADQDWRLLELLGTPLGTPLAAGLGEGMGGRAGEASGSCKLFCNRESCKNSDLFCYYFHNGAKSHFLSINSLEPNT